MSCVKSARNQLGLDSDSSTAPRIRQAQKATTDREEKLASHGWDSGAILDGLPQ